MLIYILVIVISIAVVLLYVKLIRPLNLTYWKEKGFSYKPSVPLFGNYLQAAVWTKSYFDVAADIYNYAGSKRYIGFYKFQQPMLMVKDLDLIKQMCVKDFDVFPEHAAVTPDTDSDTLWSRNLFSMNVRRWKEMRPTLSPAFTSSKMKTMYGLMEECGEELVQYLKAQNKNVVELNLKDIFSRITNDVIATTSFGIKCNSLQNKDNQFYQMGKDITNLGGVRGGLFYFLYQFSPKLSKLLGLSILSQSAMNYFQRVIYDTLREREKHGILRPDMINLLMQAKKNGLKHEEHEDASETGYATVQESEYGLKNRKKEITDLDIAAQAMIFFFAGFDTVSSAMSFTAHELAVNPEVQKKLCLEIDAVWEENDGKLDYEAVMKMKFLDMVISESLRKWPPTGQIDRRSIKPYVIEPKLPSEKSVTLDKDTLLVVPTFSIHRDPQHFPDPEKFDPERFSEENKKKINPISFMPFGVGPRNCIGSRFALLEIKILLVHLLRYFEMVPTNKTQIHIKLKPRSANFAPEGGFFLGFKRRQGVASQ